MKQEWLDKLEQIRHEIRSNIVTRVNPKPAIAVWDDATDIITRDISHTIFDALYEELK